MNGCFQPVAKKVAKAIKLCTGVLTDLSY